MRKFYKAKVYTQSEKIDSNRSISLNQSEVTGCSFVRVKVSEQNYFGQQVYVVNISDVSKKFTAKILQKQSDEQYQENQQRENFTSTICHELRTPVHTIIMFMSLIIGSLQQLVEEVGPMLQESIDYCQLSINMLHFINSFVEEMLDFKQLHEGELKLERHVFSPKKVAQFVRDIFLPQAQIKRSFIEISFDSSCFIVAKRGESGHTTEELLSERREEYKTFKDRPLRDEGLHDVIGDERRFKLVLMNLVKNALKFTANGTIRITVGYDNLNQMLLGRVEDTGVGIAPEDMPKLFCRFGKLMRTAEMNHEGIGLGLSIAKSVVEKSGGAISLTSDGVNEGTKVTFSMRVEEIGNNDYLSPESMNTGNYIDSAEKDGFFMLKKPQ